jgi:hypothetical protein
LERIKENKYMVLEYMEQNEPPTPDFLEIIIGLEAQLDHTTYTQLFVRVCALYRGEDLKVAPHMAQRAMSFLSENSDNTDACLGLLGLIYKNNIALTNFEEDLLIRFQVSYQHTISNFFKTLPLLRSHLIEQLPPTPFCFSKPMLKCLKDEGSVLH